MAGPGDERRAGPSAARAPTILGATSGDTGAAAIEAFGGQLAGTDVYILYPHGRVSDVQHRQMTTAGKRNVHALAIEGTFDDCQRIVKDLFGDLGAARRVAPVRRQLDGLGPDPRPNRLLLRRRSRFWAPRTGRCRSRFRPATSATFWPAITPSAWACRSSGSWSRPTRTTSSPELWPAGATNRGE